MLIVNEGMEGEREKSEISPRAALFIGKSGNRVERHSWGKSRLALALALG